MLRTEAILKEVDWSQAPPDVLEKAVAEYNLRLEEAQDFKAKHSGKDLEELYYGIPIVFPRSKHAAKLAMTL